MKLFLISLVLCLIAGSCLAGMSGGNFKDNAHPGKCVYDGEVFTPGEKFQPKGQCKHILCGTDGQGQIYDCGAQIVGPSCKLGALVNPNADYPDCCPREEICS